MKLLQKDLCNYCKKIVSSNADCHVDDDDDNNPDDQSDCSSSSDDSI